MPLIFMWRQSAKKVVLSCEWDAWASKQELKYDVGADLFFQAKSLPAGQQEFMFVIYGTWKANDELPTTLTLRRHI